MNWKRMDWKGLGPGRKESSPEIRAMDTLDLRAAPNLETDRAKEIREELTRRDRAGARFGSFEDDIRLTNRAGKRKSGRGTAPRQPPRLR